MYQDDQRVDWFRVLDDLKRLGLSLEAIATATLISKSCLVLYRSPEGAEPSHNKGERLIAYWCKHTGRHRSDIPMSRVALSAAAVK